MVRYVKRNSGVVIQLDNMSSFQLSMYKFLGKYMSHRWVQEPSTFDSKNARQNFETYSLGALCFAYLPEMTVHVSDSKQRCQYFDRRGNMFTMNARMMGQYLKTEENVSAPTGNLVTVSNGYVTQGRQQNDKSMKYVGEDGAVQFTNSVIAKDFQEMLSGTREESLITQQNGLVVSPSLAGGSYRHIFSAFAPRTGTDPGELD